MILYFEERSPDPAREKTLELGKADRTPLQEEGFEGLNYVSPVRFGKVTDVPIVLLAPI